MATKKLIEASSLKHQRTHGPFDMEMYREFYHDHLHKETWISHWVQDGLHKAELHPNVVFKMMINAEKRPVLGADSRSLFATTDLEALHKYIERFNEKEKSRTPASLRQTLSYCIRDEAGLASFLSIAKQNSINAPFVWKEQHRLFMGWIGHRKTIDQVADMMKIPGQWKDAKACPFLDTLIGYVTVFAQTYPAASTDIVSCLVIKFGHLYAAMLIGEAKEVNIDVFAELEKVLFQSWTKGGTNPLNFDQADFFAEITVGADDKALIREHFAEHYRKETPSHLMLTLN
uniref:RxLR effector candidate protein n=2 Tax=Hyaloperonospora arabidopsidis (strain Emoy2) TaxID=559515 RepID=M4BY75_HYAAE